MEKVSLVLEKGKEKTVVYLTLTEAAKLLLRLRGSPMPVDPSGSKVPTKELKVTL